MNTNFLEILYDIRAAREQGTEAIMQRQRARLAEMVTFARTNSPYYRELYQNLPERVEDAKLLPITNKKNLMERFDDWVTDREVTFEKARVFAEDPDMIGELFLGKYLTVVGSGTRGMRALYLMMDNNSGPIGAALTAYQASDWFPNGELTKIITREGGRATIVATKCNFPAVSGVTRLNKSNPRSGKNNRIFSVQNPLPELVEQLNQFRPVVVEGYASMMAILASEQEAGRLHINPMLVILESEGLSKQEADRVARVFNAKVGNVYACSECPSLGYSCDHGWLHIHSDWVVFEPVDANYQPTPLGEPSHTVLLSNLYNRTQPILRYDLGDSILQRPDPCPCGNPLPAIQVLGRSNDVLLFFNESGEKVIINPIMLGIEVDRVLGIDVFQFVQTSPASMRVRLLCSSGTDPDSVWLAMHAEIKNVLVKNNLDHITIERAEEPPEPSPGGKYNMIISPYNAAALNHDYQHSVAK